MAKYVVGRLAGSTVPAGAELHQHTITDGSLQVQSVSGLGIATTVGGTGTGGDDLGGAVSTVVVAGDAKLELFGAPRNTAVAVPVPVSVSSGGIHAMCEGRAAESKARESKLVLELQTERTKSAEFEAKLKAAEAKVSELTAALAAALKDMKSAAPELDDLTKATYTLKHIPKSDDAWDEITDKFKACTFASYAVATAGTVIA